MAVTGWKLSSANAVLTSNSVSWANPSYAYVDDSNYVKAIGAAGPTDVHVWTGFGFTTLDIPPGATIDGIEVNVRHSAESDSSTFYIDNIQFYDGSALVGTSQSSSVVTYSWQDEIIGGALDLWGTTSATLDDADVRNTGFGVSLYSAGWSGGWDGIWVDYIRVRVYYTESTGYADLGATVTAFTMSGVAATLTRTRAIQSSAQTFALGGNTATFQRALVLDAATQSFSLTAKTAGLARNSILPVTTQTFTLSTQATNLDRAYDLAADTQSFTVTAQPATFQRDLILDATQQPYVLAGINTALDVAGNTQFATSPSAFAIAGQAANLEYGRLMAANAQTFPLSGQDVSFSLGHNLAANAQSFAVASTATTLTYNLAIAASTQAYSLAPQSVTFTIGSTVNADTGSFAFAGNDATLSVARVLSTVTQTLALGSQSVSFLHDRAIIALDAAFALAPDTVSFDYTRAYHLDVTRDDFIVGAVDADFIFIDNSALIDDSAAILLDSSGLSLFDESNADFPATNIRSQSGMNVVRRVITLSNASMASASTVAVTSPTAVRLRSTAMISFSVMVSSHDISIPRATAIQSTSSTSIDWSILGVKRTINIDSASNFTATRTAIQLDRTATVQSVSTLVASPALTSDKLRQFTASSVSTTTATQFRTLKGLAQIAGSSTMAVVPESYTYRRVDITAVSTLAAFGEIGDKLRRSHIQAVATLSATATFPGTFSRSTAITATSRVSINHTIPARTYTQKGVTALDITASATPYTVPANTRAVVTGFTVTNTSASSSAVSILAGGAWLIKAKPVLAGETLDLTLGRMVMLTGETVQVTATQTTDLSLNLTEISE